jgi:hypothetical protein
VEEEILAPNELSAQVRDQMFALFTAYYDEVLRTTFDEDLANKNIAILLRDADRKLVGFTTLSIHEANDGVRRVRFIFSGDTVMDSNYWGPGHLLRSWFRMAGSIKAQAPDTDLYWLLLVMGHRTYRIMADFFRHYAPHRQKANDPELIRLRDDFSRAKYGDCFDHSTGLITFPLSRGQLAAHLQDAHAAVHRSTVREFLSLNPQHPQGVELACIGELSEANLKSYARVEFGKGLRANKGAQR